MNWLLYLISFYIYLHILLVLFLWKTLTNAAPSLDSSPGFQSSILSIHSPNGTRRSWSYWAPMFKTLWCSGWFISILLEVLRSFHTYRVLQISFLLQSHPSPSDVHYASLTKLFLVFMMTCIPFGSLLLLLKQEIFFQWPFLYQGSFKCPCKV